jgi:hypothetical protein
MPFVGRRGERVIKFKAVLVRMLVLTLLVLAGACASSSSRPSPAAPAKPPATGAVCDNDCVAQDSECHQKCMEDDMPPPEDGDSCASKCSKALEKCVARCR